VVSSTRRQFFTLGKDPVPILQEAGWAPGPVWTGGKSRPHRDSIPDRPARSHSLYRLSYRAHINVPVDCKIHYIILRFPSSHHCSYQNSVLMHIRSMFFKYSNSTHVKGYREMDSAKYELQQRNNVLNKRDKAERLYYIILWCLLCFLRGSVPFVGISKKLSFQTTNQR